jgi:hypothetical protein
MDSKNKVQNYQTQLHLHHFFNVCHPDVLLNVYKVQILSVRHMFSLHADNILHVSKTNNFDKGIY